MAQIVSGKSKCRICGEVIDLSHKPIAFPAFVPRDHEFSEYADSVFHSKCFESWKDHRRFQELYEHYRQVWGSRPSDLSFVEIDDWGKHAFDEVFHKGMISKESFHIARDS